jgi:hypothetical protein
MESQDEKRKVDHERVHPHEHEHDAGDRSNAVRSADDTGMISGEVLITEVELEHPEAFEEHHKGGHEHD